MKITFSKACEIAQGMGTQPTFGRASRTWQIRARDDDALTMIVARLIDAGYKEERDYSTFGDSISIDAVEKFA